jgi:purine-nucleoside phosphorylase
MLNRIKSELLNVGLKFISIDEKIVRMILETSPSNINEIVILPAIKIVMKKLLNKLQNKRNYGRVYNGELNGVKVSIVRSLIGAPNCAMAVEALKRSKTRIIIRIDVCGGLENMITPINIGDILILITPINIGDILIPKIAYCDDGTCPQYFREHPALVNELESISNPLGKFQNLFTGNQTIFKSKSDSKLNEILFNKGASLLRDKLKLVDLWTTDALFCESLDFVRALSSINVQCIDMESSILFLLGKIYNLKTSSILSVSDLPGHSKYDLLNSNEIHPEMENGIDNSIKILIKALPQIKNELI